MHFPSADIISPTFTMKYWSILIFIFFFHFRALIIISVNFVQIQRQPSNTLDTLLYDPSSNDTIEWRIPGSPSMGSLHFWMMHFQVRDKIFIALISPFPSFLKWQPFLVENMSESLIFSNLSPFLWLFFSLANWVFFLYYLIASRKGEF